MGSDWVNWSEIIFLCPLSNVMAVHDVHTIHQNTSSAKERGSLLANQLVCTHVQRSDPKASLCRIDINVASHDKLDVDVI